jgi:hypothetical protein
MVWLNASTRCRSCPNGTKRPPFRTLAPLSVHHIDLRPLYHHQDKVSWCVHKGCDGPSSYGPLPSMYCASCAGWHWSVSHMGQTIWLTFVWNAKESTKRPYIWVGGTCQGHTSAVVPAEGIHGWCVRGMSASVPVRFILNSPLHPEQSPHCFIPFGLIFFNGLIL